MSSTLCTYQPQNVYFKEYIKYDKIFIRIKKNESKTN